MEEDYHSVEEIIWNSKPVRHISEFAHGLYAGTAGLLRIPTTIRKIYNDQRRIERLDEFGRGEYDDAHIWGGLIGSVFTILGCGLSAYYGEEYSPLIIAGATNLVSGFFELGRLSISKQEHRDSQETQSQ